jgi:hypothetical protein
MIHLQVDSILIRRKLKVLNAKFLYFAVLSFLALLCLKTATTTTPKTQSLSLSSYHKRNDDKITDSHRKEQAIILPQRNTKQHEGGNTKMKNLKHCPRNQTVNKTPVKFYQEITSPIFANQQVQEITLN